MIKHTPEPWQLLPEECDRPYIRIRGTVLGCRYKIANVITPFYEGAHHREAEETRANARRIVACVNACRGLPTDELERKGLVAAVGTELLAADERAECQEREVRRLASVAANAKNQLSDALNQRDQLLAVLEEISNLPSYRQDECSEMARDAIAKVKGIDHE